MANPPAPDGNRRRLLIAATAGVGAVGAAFVATPFVLSMTPSARAKAAGAPVEVDLSKLESGMMITVEWRGRPVWIIRRSKEMLDALPKAVEKVADPESGADPSVDPPDTVVVSVAPSLVPLLHPIALQLLAATGPMAVTGAGAPGATGAWAQPQTCAEVHEAFGEAVEVYLDAGHLSRPEASSIVDVTGAQPRLLRAGALTGHDLREVVPELVGQE